MILLPLPFLAIVLLGDLHEDYQILREDVYSIVRHSLVVIEVSLCPISPDLPVLQQSQVRQTVLLEKLRVPH